MMDRSDVLLDIVQQLRISRNIVCRTHFLANTDAIWYRLPRPSSPAVRLDCDFLVALLT